MKQITFSDIQFYDLLQFTSEYTANIIDRAVDYDDDGIIEVLTTKCQLPLNCTINERRTYGN